MKNKNPDPVFQIFLGIVIASVLYGTGVFEKLADGIQHVLK